MVGSSKILTVSYGTFSCTLEGFDESFETMKAIAEYFRDLAADDRYFGAEPPTPDADMLARIAEREIARRVEAHEHEGRIVLRAQDNAQAGKALAAALGTAPAAAEAEAEAEAETKHEPNAGLAAGADLHVGEEAVAETDGAGDDAPEQGRDAAALDALKPEGLEREEPERAEPEREDNEHEEPELEEPERGDDAPEPEAAGKVSVPPLVAQADDAAAAPPVTETDNLSARLDLIRSVVGASDSYDEDEHAQDFTDSVAEPLVWDAEDEAGDDEALTHAAAADEPSPQEAARRAEPAPEAAADRLFEDTLAALLADATPVDAQAGSALLPHGGIDAPDDGTGTAPDTDAAPDIAPDTEPETDAADRRGARVFKVRRAEVETARDEGLIDPLDDAGEDTLNIFGDDASGLSPEDEADLQRELASLDAELGDESGPQEDEAESRTAPDRAAPAPDTPPDTATGSDTDERPAARAPDGKRTEVSRIFEETDSQMADPGSVRRRNTIQHLRAALAATRAEKEAGADLAKKVDSTPYRGDLDAAVRPRRAVPAPDTPRSSRPEEPRPAPLKLVAEQRVDMPQAPVRPRRVAAAAQAEVVEAQDKGFSTFAEEMGATDLPDLLEAAAAYLADVEGRTQFSRPMLMGKLREIDEEGFSREDGLRSFGQLLREGKLQKLSGGRFAVTGETEFRAAARRRAG